MIKTKEEKILADRLNGLSFRSLALKYGVTSSRIFRIVKSTTNKPFTGMSSGEDLPDDIKQLKALLRTERLRNELLNNIIDIADKELGTNIRKKSGTRQSK